MSEDNFMSVDEAKKVTVRVTVTTVDGVELDKFMLSHWRNNLPEQWDEQEAFGSSASNSGLVDRLRRTVEDVLPNYI